MILQIVSYFPGVYRLKRNGHQSPQGIVKYGRLLRPRVKKTRNLRCEIGNSVSSVDANFTVIIFSQCLVQQWTFKNLQEALYSTNQIGSNELHIFPIRYQRSSSKIYRWKPTNPWSLACMSRRQVECSALSQFPKYIIAQYRSERPSCSRSVHLQQVCVTDGL
jgi:hypothetical protein